MKIIAGPNQIAGVYGAFLGAGISSLAFFCLHHGEWKGLTVLLPVFAAGLAAFFGALCANAGVLAGKIKLGALAGAAVMLLPFFVQAILVLFGKLDTPNLSAVFTLASIAMMIGTTAGAVGGWVGRRTSNRKAGGD